MSYLYETHLHTRYASACGISEGPEYVGLYREKGYSGIIVTDHFFNGNTAIPRDLPWKEWVAEFCYAYEKVRKEGERQGLSVFFGWEETFDDCDDYLVYGLDKAWLLKHPESRSWSRGEQYRAVKAAGGCVVQAHPFRQHSYINRVILSTACVDGVEAANGGNAEQSYDALAMRYARRLGLPVTAGSDMHDGNKIRQDRLFGVYTEKKLETIADYVNAICNKGISRLKMVDGRCDYHGNETVRIPVDIRDSSDRSTGKNWKDFI